MAGIYVHIPFCLSRCAYCDFYSTTRPQRADDYLVALSQEMQARRQEPLSEGVAASVPFHTVYLGGGTPSVLTVAQMETLMATLRNHYVVADDVEATVEMNPEDIVSGAYAADAHSLLALRMMFNRVSLGIQSFDDQLLSIIRRRHNSSHAIEAVHKLQDAGFTNISVDLIYGLPGQTLEMWERDLDKAFSLGIQHLSAYALIFEPGTAITRWRDEGKVQEADEETSVAMYDSLCRKARLEGFEHYEISNFARPGFASRHNSSYWNGVPYLGFGPGAHSYDGLRTRRANKPSLEAYMTSPACQAHQSIEYLTDEELYNETVLCGLRTSKGIDLEAVRRRFGADRLDYLLRMAKPYLQGGLLINTLQFLHLSELAVMTSDDIISSLMA